jgi:mannose-6-phosphate isomerase-like protein (cupin superfamily)
MFRFIFLERKNMRMSETTHSGAAHDITAPVSKSSAPHYTWASVCDGWRLIDTPGLSVVEERVPPGAGEIRHYHNEARQFFYVLSGAAVLEMEGREDQIPAGSGIEVAPGVQHKFMNQSEQDVVFLVISSPSTKADRIDVE